MPWLSLPAYARRTGTPESTVRAMIRAERIRAELEQRAPGDSRTVWRVWLDDPPEQPRAHPQPSADLTVPSESPEPPAATTSLPDITTGLLELIAADRATIATLYAEQASLRERVGRAEERATAAEERATAAEAERERLLAELEHARRPWWRRLWG